MYKVLEVTPPKFPDLNPTYKLVLDNDAAPGKCSIYINSTHLCTMPDGTEKQVSQLKVGDQIIMY